MVHSLYGFMLVLWLLSSYAHAQTQTLAFPTAEGFGRFAQGGRGGRVIQVTNLNASGPGSLRACVEATGPRTCIFRVGGIIDFGLCEYCLSMPPYLTIAGQTAPGDGIMLKGLQLTARDTHDVIIRHVRSRVGNNPPPGGGSFGAFEVFGPGTQAYNIIFDHVSGGWAQDDAFAVAAAHDVTMQWSVISEGLGNGSGDPSKITLIGGSGTDRVSLLHNLWTDTGYRVPNIQEGTVQVVNNVAYNIGGGGFVYPVYGVMHAEFVNNYYQSGSSSGGDGTTIATIGCEFGGKYRCAVQDASLVSVQGNYSDKLRPSDSQPETDFVFSQCCPSVPITSTLQGMPVIPSQTSAQQARTDVLARAGAMVPRRDSIDTRAVNNMINGTSLGFDTGTVATYGGYPTYNSGTPYPDADGDGMSDAWELAHGLNPHDPSDGPRMAANGYTNLENFLNELAGDNVFGTTILPVPTNLRAISQAQ